MTTLEPHDERLINEYNELNSRIKKLETVLFKIAINTCEFEPDSSYYTLQTQRDIMVSYRSILEVRFDDIRLKRNINLFVYIKEET